MAKKEKKEKAPKVKSNKRINYVKLVTFLAMIFLVISLILAVVNSLVTSLVPVSYILIALAATIILIALNVILFKKKIIIIFTVLDIGLTIGFIMVFLMLGNVKAFVTQITGEEKETKAYSALVMMEDEAKKTNKTYAYRYGINANGNKEMLDTAMVDLIKDLNNVKPIFVSLDGEATCVQKLFDGEVQAILFDESFRTLMENTFKDFSTETRILNSYEQEKSLIEGIGEFYNKENCFSVYINGTDESNNNILNALIAVNYNTNNCIIITLPDNAYIPFKNNNNNKYDCIDTFSYLDNDTIKASIKEMFAKDINYTVNIRLDKDYLSDNNSNDYDILNKMFNDMKNQKLLLNKDYATNISNQITSNIPYDHMVKMIKKYMEAGSRWNVVSYLLTGNENYKDCEITGIKEKKVVIIDPMTFDTCKDALEKLYKNENILSINLQ